MIIKIFEKSKPINLVIATAILIFGFLSSSFLPHFTWNINKLIGLLVAVFSILTADFISKKNLLSNQNSFIILFYVLFFSLFWTTATDYAILYANFFTLLALRKIISLKSQKNTTKKIFDAGFWISVATLFSFWSILVFILLFIAILIYNAENYKHFLVPFISVFTLYVIVNSYSLFRNHTLYQYNGFNITFNFSEILSNKNYFILGGLVLLISSLFIFIGKKIRHLTKKNRTSYILISIALLIAIIIFIFNPKMEILLFTCFPISVLLSAVFEQISKKWIQNLIFYSILIAAGLLYFT